MGEEKKVYDALSYIIDKKSKSSSFFLEATGKEYHMVSDGDIIIMLTYNRDDDEYEISTLNLGGQWIDMALNQLMATNGSTDYELMWRYLNYFNITPDKIYELYINDNFEYCPNYKIESEEEEQE
jgi:hypothetical protein